MLCGTFSESKEKKLRFDDVDSKAFIKTLDIWCGRADGQQMEFYEVPQLASVADRFQITGVVSALEETVLWHLSLEACGTAGRCWRGTKGTGCDGGGGAGEYVGPLPAGCEERGGCV